MTETTPDANDRDRKVAEPDAPAAGRFRRFGDGVRYRRVPVLLTVVALLLVAALGVGITALAVAGHHGDGRGTSADDRGGRNPRHERDKSERVGGRDRTGGQEGTTTTPPTTTPSATPA